MTPSKTINKILLPVSFKATLHFRPQKCEQYLFYLPAGKPKILLQLNETPKFTGKNNAVFSQNNPISPGHKYPLTPEP